MHIFTETVGVLLLRFLLASCVCTLMAIIATGLLMMCAVFDVTSVPINVCMLLLTANLAEHLAAAALYVTS